MDDLTTQEGARIIEIFILENKSTTRAKQRIANELHVQLDRKQITRLYDYFRNKNCFKKTHLAARKGIAGTSKTVATAENLDRVAASVLNSPRKSLRRRSSELDLSLRSVHRMMKELGMKAYKIREVQELKEADYGERVYYCNWLIDQLNLDPMLLFKLMFSDEANFFLNGCVSSSHAFYWATEDPHERQQRSMDRRGVMVFMAITASHVFGPYFFDENVNQVSYRELLTTQLLPDLQRYNVQLEDVWFMQDGAPAHRANQTLNLLRDVFGDNLISLGAEVEWPPRSPDLTPCDYFLWGFLKQMVYKRRFETLEELKAEITRCAEFITPEMLEATFTRSLIERTNLCLHANGGHFE
jgi:hypothetical protein